MRTIEPVEGLVPMVLDGMAVAVLAATATVAGYLAFLGWDQKKDIARDGGETGPYQPWQVIGLTVVLVVITVWAARLHHPIVAALVIPLVLTVVWSIDASNDPEDDGLWPVGATMLYIGSTLGLGFVSLLMNQLKPRTLR
jgi:hypothetical protein